MVVRSGHDSRYSGIPQCYYTMFSDDYYKYAPLLKAKLKIENSVQFCSAS